MNNLTIVRDTPEGDAKIEAIKWAEEQINAVLKKYFNGDFKLLSSFQINFEFPRNSDVGVVRLNLSYSSCNDEKKLDEIVSNLRHEIREDKKLENKDSMAVEGA
jgi:hypothetical protein